MHADDDIAPQPHFFGGHALDLLAQDRRTFEKAHDVLERDGGLRARGGQQQHVTNFAGSELVLRDRTYVHTDRSGDPRLA